MYCLEIKEINTPLWTSYTVSTNLGHSLDNPPTLRKVEISSGFCHGSFLKLPN